MARKMAMAAREGKDYLDNKKLVIFLMTERRLTDPEVTWETLELPPAPEKESEPAAETAEEIEPSAEAQPEAEGADEQEETAEPNAAGDAEEESSRD
jgi:hypothetical protein